MAAKGEKKGSHLPVGPLYFLDDVQAAMQDELVHVARLLRKPGEAVAALLRSAKLILEEGVVLRADDGKVIGHGVDARETDHLSIIGIQGRRSGR